MYAVFLMEFIGMSSFELIAVRLFLDISQYV